MVKEVQKILDEILSIEQNNPFIEYIVNRIQLDNYRGWHVSQHNRYDLNDIEIILRNIYDVAGETYFEIPPGDYNQDDVLPEDFQKFQTIVSKINSKMGRGTINSLKKNFFPDLERMRFLIREKIKPHEEGQGIPHGRLTSSAVEFINAKYLIGKYKKFTDGIDNLFGNKISELAEMIHLSAYAGDKISIYEFMFIFSDNDEDIDKIGLLDSYRRLKKYQRNKIIKLVQKYADPKNFKGNKTSRRDFHNWKNQAQQIMSLLKTTVYFEVDLNKCFRLNIGRTGFFQEQKKRSVIPKREYFIFHQIEKRDKFELHHIVPISSARNKEEAKIVDDYRNLIYIHRSKHQIISQSGSRNVVLRIDPSEAIFSDLNNKHHIKTTNETDVLYAKKQSKVNKIAKYNTGLLRSIFEFEQSEKQ